MSSGCVLPVVLGRSFDLSTSLEDRSRDRSSSEVERRNPLRTTELQNYKTADTVLLTSP
uniref:Uncharacterized protein n=1 Tax=Candidatus Kentrum eta TaxID=2126337 RepID=A0A450V4H1_9GAMM|nr:MAG: hypothetical protein BECKH772A_GA0070896_1003518 [Candidatus Kentron sp. H]VFJ92884.1 MAG: hypothetical protein BECKH772B_GA0070898_1003518 [Candidatus Kentron sp. H]VFJ99724.1 MAG: hypothetical protein BECKH772C_GA0070978_1003418 [Candidatus Kentron sp. H]